MATSGRISKHFYSWEQIHRTVFNSVEQLQEEFRPTLLVGISGGGLVPSRMLRSGFKLKTGRTLPIQVVGAVHYDDDAGQVLDKVVRTQWLAPDAPISGERILLVDEVDDSRKTLAFIVAEMLKYFEEARAAHTAANNTQPWIAPVLGVYVIHNKLRPKEAEIDPSVMRHYYAGEHTPNMWHVYPWDAPNITSHTAIAHAQEHFFRERPGELAMAMQASTASDAKQAVSAYEHYANGGNTGAPHLSKESLQQLLSPSSCPAKPDPSPAVPPSTTPLSCNSNDCAHQQQVQQGASVLSSAPSEGGRRSSQAVHGEGAAKQDGMHKAPNGAWHSEPDGMYYNMGYIPEGLEPRIGSLTLVDSHGGSFMHAAGAAGASAKQQQQ